MAGTWSPGRWCKASIRWRRAAGSSGYDLGAGQFLQTDPIGSKDDLDLYAYTGNDPVNRSDPTGTESPTVTLGLTPGGFEYDSPEGRADVSRLADGFQAGFTFITDMLPVVGDAKAGYEAYKNPTLMNIGVAAIGIIPLASEIRGLERGIRSLEKQIVKHEAKIASEIATPTVKPEMKGMSQEAISAQQARRIELKKQEIQKFKNEIAKKQDEIRRLKNE